MPNSAPSLQVAVVDHAAIVKVNGRANFNTSVAFKRLFGELRQRGYQSFVLDLTECLTMDSTFLGVLAGTAVQLTESGSGPAANGARKNLPGFHLRLLNPNQRVADLLDNLGVSDLFSTLQCDLPATAGQTLAPAEDQEATREELVKACLEAHQVLMELNPKNITKFKDVAQFLAEDLQRLHSGENSGPGASGNP